MTNLSTERSEHEVVRPRTPRATPRLPADLGEAYRAVRQFSERLAEPLGAEDCAIQSMTEASPTKWHLAHTTWFFETFVLSVAGPERRPFDPRFGYLFNSYYDAVGDRHPRSRRGILSRPTLQTVRAYRHTIDEQMSALLRDGAPYLSDERRLAVEVGLHHEQQHQELMLTDIKHLFGQSPLRPVYRSANRRRGDDAPPLRWHRFGERLVEIGHDGPDFAFDNETPRHRVYLRSFDLASRLVTNAEYIAFIEDGGYRKPTLWLSDGWDRVQTDGWTAPLYWEQRDGEWWHYTLAGMRPVDPAEPVSHVSLYEADAFATWAGARLPTEAEWESAASNVPVAGNFVEDGRDHPTPVRGAIETDTPLQLYGDVWEWTRSAYSPYPGFQPWQGALGEYNGKFMSNQVVLRGGSCATSITHIRPTYRNFFHPGSRWQFMGIRLARDS